MQSFIDIRKTHWVIIGVPALIILSAIVLALSPLVKTHSILSLGITADLALTAPLVYLLLVRNNKKFSKLTAVPLFILGMLIAQFVLPAGQQMYVQWLKMYLFPIVELSVLTFVVRKVVLMVRAFKNNREADSDFFTVLKQTTRLKFGKVAGSAIATEVAMFYYGLISWRSKLQTGPTFTYHKTNGLPAFYGVIIFLILVETLVLHILLVRWNEIIAWILFVLSLYGGIQLFGHLKACLQRPVQISGGQLRLRYGLFGDALIPLENIERVERSTKDIEPEDGIHMLGLLQMMEAHNLILHFKEEQSLEGAYGLTKKIKALAMHIDEPEAFEESLIESAERSSLDA